MKFRLLTLFLFVLVTYNVSAKRYSGGGSRSRTPSYSKPSYTRHTPSVSRPASTTHTQQHNSAKKASSDFLFSESGRPSRPAPSHSSPHNYGSSQSSGSHVPSAPSHPTYSKPVQDHHQQSSAPVSHSDPYSRQPAQNPHASNAPYVPSGGYSQSSSLPAAPHGISVPSYSSPHSSNPAPYPSHLPNHPHPDSALSSSHFPSHSNPPAYSPQIHPQTYPNSHSSYPTHGGPPPAYGSSGSYQPSYSHQPPPPYHPAPAYQPATAPFVPGKTVYVVQDSRKSGPGIGSIIAGGVAGGVAAGATNAIVDHAISAIFRPSSNHVHTYPSAPPVGTPTSTVTTNNYYYGSSAPSDGNNNNNNAANNQPNNNNSPAPVQNGAEQPQNTAPAQAGSGITTAPGNPGVRSGLGDPATASNGALTKQENPPPPAQDNGIVSDENFMKLTEELFDKQDTNLNQYVELNLQKKVENNNNNNNNNQATTTPDEASEPLFKLKPELDTISTVSSLRALYDNYQRDGTQKEVMTPERRNEENAFLDEIMKTPVMKRALDWLVGQKLIEADDYEQKELLKRMWFNNFEGTSSGFERIFLSEKFGDGGIVGMQNWIYFADLESKNNVNYLGYVDKLNLSDKGALLKLNYQTEGFTMQNATIFVGTPPELELALYTLCFHARPNNWCPISLGGNKFFMLTHSFRYFGKDLIDLGFPAF